MDVGLLGPQCGIPSLAAARMQRWALILSAYSYDLQFRNTEKHGNVDTLSRFPSDSNSFLDDGEVNCFSIEIFEDSPVVFKDIVYHTKRDELLAQVIQRLRFSWYKNDATSKLKSFYHRRLELTQEKGAILWGRRVVVPLALQKKVLEIIHEDHGGSSRMKAFARGYVWWPALIEDLEKLVKKWKSV